MITRLTLLLLLSLVPSASLFAQDRGGGSSRYFFGFGPAYFSNLNSRNMAVAFSPGISWAVDPQFDLSVNADFAFSFKHNDVRVFVPQLKGRYVLDEEKNHAWYVGGGMGIGYGSSHESAGLSKDSATGFALSFAVGMKFFRKSAMQMTAEFEHLMILQESRYGTPLMTSIKVGVLFP